ncbi:MAG TPA: hypothetical protein VGI10_15180 [Polyangiaceae bacterium]|jgi:hypothetical protein
MNRFTIFAVIAGLWALGACSSSNSSGTGDASCTFKGSCPNSPAPSASNVLQCQSLLADPKCGSLYRVYLDCAFAQEKCNAAGVTDDVATKAAIMANCGAQSAQAEACSGMTQTPTCGYEGAPCCTDGSAPCVATVCCDQATNKCLGPGVACTASGTVCSAGQCGACGAPGQPCCNIIDQTTPNPCPAGGCCNYSAGELGGTCIAEGGQCEAPGPQSTETVCRSGDCVTCGSTLDTCCADGKCSDANATCTNDMCK